MDMYGANPRDLEFRFQRVVPIEVSPHDPNRVYHGSQFVHVTSDGGKNWEQISPDLTAFRPERQVYSGWPITRDITGEEHYSVLYVIEESPVERGVIYTGANDGPVHVTRDGGQTWTDITPADMPPEGRIQTIDVSPHTPGKMYFAGYRYLLGDFEPYAYRTDDYGETWTRLTTGSNGVPMDWPTRAIREDPEREGLVYLGTEFGMFISFDDGANWQSFQQNLPVTPITDIKRVDGDLVVSTMGRSFWILDSVDRLHQLDDVMADAHLFEPRELPRTRYSGGGGFGDGPSPATPQYAVASSGFGRMTRPAIIDYYFANDQAGEVTLEFLDSQGNVVNTYASGGSGQTEVSGQGMRAPWTAMTGQPAVATTAGVHRFYWNLRYPGPMGPDGEERGAGPVIVPGDYQVRLTAGGRSMTAPLTVVIDPRVAEDGVTQQDLEQQFQLAMDTRDMLTDAYHTEGELDQSMETLSNTNGGENSDAYAELVALQERLEIEGASYPPRMLLNQIRYLYSMITTADQEPGADAQARFIQLREQLDDLIADLERLQRTVTDTQDGGTP